MKPRMLAFTLLLLACSADSVTRDEWQAMTASDRSLYVQSLLGAEQAKESKGGNERVFDRPAGEYVQRIDDAYARGDRRDAAAIFEGMAQPAPRR